MKKKNARTNADVATLVRTYLLIAMCILLFAGGLFFAGRQHFSSMDFGMRNARLRKQIEELEAEKRRLILAREVSMSPAEIKKAAERIGLLHQAGEEKNVAQVTSVSKDKVAPRAIEPSHPLITKTVVTAPAAKPERASFQKSAKNVVAVKKTSIEKRGQTTE